MILHQGAWRGRSGDRSAPVLLVPERWAWHLRVLETLRQRWIEDRESEMVEAREAMEPHSTTPEDCAADAFDHDLALSLLSQHQKGIDEVNDAIHRIHAGTYGRCEVSGLPIPAARLRAVPWTRHCKAVEERLEQQRLEQEQKNSAARTEPFHSVHFVPSGDVPMAPTEGVAEPSGPLRYKREEVIQVIESSPD